MQIFHVLSYTVHISGVNVCLMQLGTNSVNEVILKAIREVWLFGTQPEIDNTGSYQCDMAEWMLQKGRAVPMVTCSCKTWNIDTRGHCRRLAVAALQLQHGSCIWFTPVYSSLQWHWACSWLTLIYYSSSRIAFYWFLSITAALELYFVYSLLFITAASELHMVNSTVYKSCIVDSS